MFCHTNLVKCNKKYQFFRQELPCMSTKQSNLENCNVIPFLYKSQYNFDEVKCSCLLKNFSVNLFFFCRSSRPEVLWGKQVFSCESCEISKNILLPFLLLFSMKHSYMLILPGCFSTNLEEYKFKYPDRIQSLMVLQSFFVRNFLKEISIIIILFFLLLNFPASCS